LLIGLQTLFVSGFFAQKPFTLWAGTPYETPVSNITATDTEDYLLCPYKKPICQKFGAYFVCPERSGLPISPKRLSI
jgi:hypothetical protein